MNAAAPLRLYLISGEASGDRLGAALMKGLKATSARPVEFLGVGGPMMQAEGLKTLFPPDELAIMGLVEVLPRLRGLLRRIRQTAADAIAARPDALITIDSPGFTMRVARKLKAARPDCPVIHYVAPSVWAWRPGRAKTMAAHVDHVLALLPFEPPHMRAAGMSCDFTGHPVAALAPPETRDPQALRAALGIGDRPLVAVLPGSRAGEVANMAGPFGETLGLLRARHPDIAVIAPAAPGVAAQVAAALRDWPLEATLIDPRGLDPAEAERRKFQAFAAADLALAASGTVTLELAAMATPQAVAYRGNPLTAFIVERIVRVDSANLINILLGEKIIPEFLQRYMQPPDMAAALAGIIENPDARVRQIAAAARALDMLGRGGPDPGLRAARSVLAHLGAGGAHKA